jgi:membrane protein DedA with SNARE-associated domain
MFDKLTYFLLPLVKRHGYLTIGLTLYVCGLGVPIPEEISLVLAGVAAHSHWVNLWIITVLCVVSIIAGDLTMFFIARRWGHQLLRTRFFNWLLPPPRMEKVHGYFDRHGSKTVFFARFLAGIRMPVYFTAGMTKMNPVRFVLLDLAGTLISGPTSVIIAWKLSDTLEKAMKGVKHAGHLIFGCVVVVGAGVMAWHLWKGHRERVAAKAEMARRAAGGETTIHSAPKDEAVK